MDLISQLSDYLQHLEGHPTDFKAFTTFRTNKTRMYKSLTVLNYKCKFHL